jgi:predicted GIY-YIG superfamily endonuclease
MAENQFTVYILELQDGRHYVGQTNDLHRRLQEHQDGRSPFTSKFGFKKLLYSETYSTRANAMKRENFLKSGQGRQWIKSKLTEQSA